MAVRTLSARVALDGEKEYKQALQELNTGNATLRTEMQKLQAEYKNNGESTEYLTKRGELLERQLLQQQDKVNTLREALQHAAQQYGEADARTQKWMQQLNRAEAEQFNLQHAIEDNTKAMQGQGETMVGLGDTVEDLGQKFGIRLPEQLKTALNGMESFSAGTVAALGIAAAAAAALIEGIQKLHEVTLQVAADVDETLTQSAITGVSTELLQQWEYAAEFIDVSADTITGSMSKITRAMSEARDGNGETAEAFAKLGVSVTDSEGQLRSTQDVFDDVIDALGNVQNETERNTIAMQLMGKSAQDLNPLILAGRGALEEYAAEAEALGYVLDESQLKKLGEVDDSYQKLQKTLEAGRKQLAADFAPASKAAMDLFSEAVQKAGKFLDESGLIENLAAAVQSVLGLIDAGMELVSDLPSWMNPLQQLSNMFKGLAIVTATVADAINAIEGLKPWNWGSGKFTTAMGWNIDKGQMSNLQSVLRSGSDYVSYNATGNDNWRGGLTWVGEAGPELVRLPQGSQIMNAQDSRGAGGDTFYITIDAASVKEFNDIVEMAQSARVRQRMR